MPAGHAPPVHVGVAVSVLAVLTPTVKLLGEMATLERVTLPPLTPVLQYVAEDPEHSQTGSRGFPSAR